MVNVNGRESFRSECGDSHSVLSQSGRNGSPLNSTICTEQEEGNSESEQKGGAMNLGSMVKDVGGKIADQVGQKAAETMNDANKLMALLQEAGYKISEFEVAVKAVPKITIGLKMDTIVSDSKLDEIMKANKDNDVIVMVFAALAQANKLRAKVNLSTIELKSAKIEFEGTPSVSLEWTSAQEHRR